MKRILYINTYNSSNLLHGGATSIRKELAFLESHKYKVDFVYPLEFSFIKTIYLFFLNRFTYPLSVCYYYNLKDQWLKLIEQNTYSTIIFSHDQSTFGIHSLKKTKFKVLLRKHNDEYKNLKGIKLIDFFSLKYYERELYQHVNHILNFSSQSTNLAKNNFVHIPPIFPFIESTNFPNSYKYKYGTIMSLKWWPNRRALKKFRKYTFYDNLHVFGSDTNQVDLYDQRFI